MSFSPADFDQTMVEIELQFRASQAETSAMAVDGTNVRNGSNESMQHVKDLIR